MEKIEKILKELIKELATMHPHIKVIVDSNSAEIVEGIRIIKE